MMNRVKKVATPRPQKIVLAMGAHISDLPPKPTAIGNTPNMVVIEVKIMGRSLSLPASIIDCHLPRPFFRALLIKVSITIESFTAIPARPIKPYKTTMEKGCPVTIRANMAPIKVKGTAKSIINGCMYDLNWAPSII